jgi:hypothetical protein
MRERPRFDENRIADRKEFNVRAGRGKIPACALVVHFIVICGGIMRREPFPRRNFWWDSGRKKSQKLAAKMKREAGQVFPPPCIPHEGKPADLTEGGRPVVCWLPIKPPKHANGFIQDGKKIRIFMKSLWN